MSRLAIARDTDLQFKNKTERDYWFVLKARSYLDVQYEAVTLRLGHDCRYTPDFFVVTPEWEIQFHEVKGRRREDAMVKLRVAARLFPWFRFYLVEAEKRKMGLSFELTEVKT